MTAGWWVEAAMAASACLRTPSEIAPTASTRSQGNEPCTRNSACLASLTAGLRKSVDATAFQSIWSNSAGSARKLAYLAPAFERERPPPVVLASPGDDGMKVGLQVDDRRLTTAVGEVGVVRAVDDEQHDRSRAEVERDVVADVVIGMTGHREREPSLLDGRHPDACLGTASRDHRCIRQELACGHDRAEVVDVRDVEDLGAGGRRGHRTRSAWGAAAIVARCWGVRQLPCAACRSRREYCGI